MRNFDVVPIKFDEIIFSFAFIYGLNIAISTKISLIDLAIILSFTWVYFNII